MGFFENIGKKAEGIFNKAQTAVENGCERFQLTQDIQAHKNELERLFAELGRLAYHGTAELAGVRPKQAIVDDIANVSSKIQALEDELEEKEQPQAVPDDEPSMAEVPPACYCHKCGIPQPEENDFCHKCGAKLNK